MTSPALSKPQRWLLHLTEADRRRLRGLMYGIRRGYPITAPADTDLAKRLEDALAPAALRAEKRSRPGHPRRAERASEVKR